MGNLLMYLHTFYNLTRTFDIKQYEFTCIFENCVCSHRNYKDCAHDKSIQEENYNNKVSSHRHSILVKLNADRQP